MAVDEKTQRPGRHWRTCHPTLSPRIHAARSNHGRRMGGQSRASLHAASVWPRDDRQASSRWVGLRDLRRRQPLCLFAARCPSVGGSSGCSAKQRRRHGLLLVFPSCPQRCTIPRALGRGGKVVVTTAGPGGPARSVWPIHLAGRCANAEIIVCSGMLDSLHRGVAGERAGWPAVICCFRSLSVMLLSERAEQISPALRISLGSGGQPGHGHGCRMAPACGSFCQKGILRGGVCCFDDGGHGVRF